jgi:hypothetical protein
MQKEVKDLHDEMLKYVEIYAKQTSHLKTLVDIQNGGRLAKSLSYIKTTSKVKVNNRMYNVYESKRCAKYIKKNNEYVLLSKVQRPKSS